MQSLSATEEGERWLIAAFANRVMRMGVVASLCRKEREMGLSKVESGMNPPQPPIFTILFVVDRELCLVTVMRLKTD